MSEAAGREFELALGRMAKLGCSLHVSCDGPNECYQMEKRLPSGERVASQWTVPSDMAEFARFSVRLEALRHCLNQIERILKTKTEGTK